jgi:hypothetical protein
MFEPLLEMLLFRLQNAKINVDEIWSLDMPLSGETALANPIGYLYGALVLLESYCCRSHPRS